jgi:hypothetical protein
MPRNVFAISSEQIGRLPLAGTAYAYAARLGVTRKTMSQWICQDNLPAFRQPNGSYIIDRELFHEWARKTGRCPNDTEKKILNPKA